MTAQSFVFEISIRLFFVLAITTIPIMTTKAQAPGPTPAPAQTTPAPPAPSAADVATMDSTVAALYDVISAGGKAQLGPLPIAVRAGSALDR
jgi:hypothetical protein